MSNKIGLLGTDGSIRSSYSMNSLNFLNSVGANTGNLFFQYAVFNEIAEEVCIVGKDIPWDHNLVRENCRILVIPSANFIRENFDLTGYVNFPEKCNLPLLFLGIGVQANDFNKKDFNLHPSILKLIDLIKSKSICVGVRGAYSAEILSGYGVTNISIIGCPSNFVNKDPLLAEKLESKWKSESIAITTTGDEPWPILKNKKDAEQKLFSIAFNSRGLYVQQSVEPLVKAVRANNIYCDSDANSLIGIEKLRLALAPSIDINSFRNFLVSSVRLYISVDQWMEDMSRFDLSLGLRLHGNMVPFQAGCPSIWMHHDARTRELIETMSLPSLSIEKFLKCKDIFEIKAEVNADFSKYYTKRNYLYEEYKRLFNKNHIQQNISLD